MGEGVLQVLAQARQVCVELYNRSVWPVLREKETSPKSSKSKRSV